ncbi:S-layer homology domain-containing protein [Lysinibacillus telephonicus]|uniref:S-layer homology domain-containing protein n=1 Tax=Lysinibacillus telephonicus TaxID=1714840 RepID=UPI003B9DFD0B
MKKYSKFMATATAATLVASAFVPVASAAFDDVKENNSHAEAINALVEAGIIKGYEDGSFRPNAQLTRGHVVKMLGKWVEKQGFEIPADWNTVQRFDDVEVDAKDQELVKYAALVKEAGVFIGSNGKLNAGGHISRENMALTLDRAYKAVIGTSLVEMAENAKDLVVADLTSAKAESREEIQALRNLGISIVEKFEPKNSVTRAQFASFLNRTIETITYEEELEVASVSTMDSSKIVVEFTQPIDGTEANLQAVKVEKVGVTTSDTSTLSYRLSEDGKALTISTDIKNNAFFDGDYNVVIDSETVKGAAGEFVPSYNTTVHFNDTQAPTFTTEQVSSLVYKVNFSEPVQADVVGKITFKDAQGQEVAVGKSLNEEQTVLTLTIDQDVEAKKEFTATITDAKDIAGNLLDPNPATFTMVKGEKDGVAPTVETITQTGENTFTVKVSEELLANPTVKLGTTADSLEITTVEVDENDPTLFHVTANSKFNSAPYYVEVSSFTDLSGEAGETVTKLVEFTKEEEEDAAPTVESATLDAATKTIEITFSEAIKLNEAAVNDFEIYVDGEAFEAPIKFDANLLDAEATSANTISVVVSDLTTDDMQKQLTIVGLEGTDITDVNGNSIKFETAIALTAKK